MLQKFKLPTQFFVVFEKIQSTIWTSFTLTPNSYVIFLNNNWLYISSLYFKRDIFFHDSFCVENSSIPVSLDASLLENDLLLISKLNLYNYYLIYFYNIKVKLFLFLYNTNNNVEFTSIDTVFPNTSWLERETSEMYGIFFRNKKDTRKLLLDYSRTEFPLLKDFSSEGYVDCFYNIFENDVTYINNDIVEL